MEMKSSTERVLRTIVWSDQSYSLNAFLSSSSFPLPQLVQVEGGIYSEDEAKTLSSGQILTLHFTKRTDKILGKFTGGKELFIPINFPLKVEILPTVCEDVYYSVQDVVDAICVKFIRVVHDAPPTYKVKAGDILEIKKTIEENHTQYLECEFVNKTHDSVKLPLDYMASFEPLAETGQYYLYEALQKFNLPVRVKFISSEDILNAEVNDENDWFSIGSVLLKETNEESTVICTSRDEGIVTVLMLPTDLDVSVYPALGALTNDKAYTRFCKSIHDGADLQKAIELSKMKESKLFIESEIEVEVLYDYEEIKPIIPPRSPTHPKGYEDEAEYRNVTPSIPPREPAPKRPPKPKPRSRTKVNSSKPNKEDAPSQCVSHLGRMSLKKDANSLPQTLNGNGTAERTGYLIPHIDKNSSAINLAQPIWVKAEPKKGEHLYEEDVSEDEDVYYEIEDDRYVNWDPGNSDLSDFVNDNVSAKKISQNTAIGPPEGNDKVDESPLSGVDNYHSDVFFEQPTRVPSYDLPKFPPCKVPRSGSKNVTASAPSSTSDFPDDLCHLKVPEVGECLRKLHLEKYVETFARNQIDGEMFCTLNNESLISVGVGNAFDRKKIVKFIHGWRPKFQKT
ncbi:PREDICTED: uncharacterized protein LOC107331306 [Acropora digitifera]|uniref:uncharacterized protein LOC107331306 n=1 Tax=Acropora digitifera TaxID=70779 RepID=UPI00077AE65B|nr:PREDICTED: uncharacterized protein LOC107331306 [Acropora digitifera]